MATRKKAPKIAIEIAMMNGLAWSTGPRRGLRPPPLSARGRGGWGGRGLAGGTGGAPPAPRGDVWGSPWGPGGRRNMRPWAAFLRSRIRRLLGGHRRRRRWSSVLGQQHEQLDRIERRRRWHERRWPENAKQLRLSAELHMGQHVQSGVTENRPRTKPVQRNKDILGVAEIQQAAGR